MLATCRLLSTPEVLARLGIGQTTLWRLEKRNEFPKALRIGQRCKRWLEDDVEAYLAALAVAR